jgi:hypothetical protein
MKIIFAYCNTPQRGLNPNFDRHRMVWVPLSADLNPPARKKSIYYAERTDCRFGSGITGIVFSAGMKYPGYVSISAIIRKMIFKNSDSWGVSQYAPTGELMI